MHTGLRLQVAILTVHLLELIHSWDGWSAQSLCPVFGPMKEEVNVREVNKVFCLYDN